MFRSAYVLCAVHTNVLCAVHTTHMPLYDMNLKSGSGLYMPLISSTSAKVLNV